MKKLVTDDPATLINFPPSPAFFSILQIKVPSGIDSNDNIFFGVAGVPTLFFNGPAYEVLLELEYKKYCDYQILLSPKGASLPLSCIMSTIFPSCCSSNLKLGYLAGTIFPTVIALNCFPPLPLLRTNGRLPKIVL